jgi:lysophospholipase L1-like esterase
LFHNSRRYATAVAVVFRSCADWRSIVGLLEDSSISDFERFVSTGLIMEPHHAGWSLYARGRIALSAIAVVILGACAVTAQRPSDRWIDAWGVSFLPTMRNGALDPVPTFSGQTLRVVVLSRLAGSQVRVKLTNKFQTVPLEIGAAHIALRAGAQGGSISAGTDRTLLFDGRAFLTLAPGEERWSDPVTLAVPQHADVAISLYLPAENYKPTAVHGTGSKTSFISAAGDHTAAISMPALVVNADAQGRRGSRSTTEMVFFVSGLQVMAPARTKVIVALGDSITDGAASAVDGNASWPEVLSKRLPALSDGTPVSVINMGIGSNRLVASDKAGPPAVSRFADDVLARPNVTHVILLEGINDISYENAPPEQLIAAYKDLIARAHAKGIKIFGATLLPIQKSVKDTPANEATRQAVNRWIRTAGAFDAVIDFEQVVRDPANPLIIRSDLTGDFVHPNSAGYRLMGESIDLKLFE